MDMKVDSSHEKVDFRTSINLQLLMCSSRYESRFERNLKAIPTVRIIDNVEVIIIYLIIFILSTIPILRSFWDVTPYGSCKNRRFGGT
jgi:hypothetical protein